MNHIITTTSFFDVALTKAESNPTNIVVFAKAKDSVPVTIVQEVSKAKNVDIQVLISETKEENLLWLGSLLAGKKADDNFLILGDTIVLSDHIKKVYDIKTEKPSKRGNGIQAEKKPRKPRKKMALTNEPDTSAVSEPIPAEDPAATNTEPALKPVPTNPDIDSDLDADGKAFLEEIAEAELAEQEGSNEEESVIEVFIKAMAVRAKDLKNFDGTDEELANELATALQQQDDWKKEELEAALAEWFGNEDGDKIYAWIKPNIKRVNELAHQFH